MNGATAELCANIMSTPKSSRIMIIGVTQHHLFLEKKTSSWPRVPNRPVTSAMNGIGPPFHGPSDFDRFLDETVAKHQHVHSAPDERAECFSGRVDDRLALQ